LEANIGSGKRLELALLVRREVLSPCMSVTLFTGDIYLGINMILGKEVAIKVESLKAKHLQLEYESKVYKTLAGGVGIPSPSSLMSKMVAGLQMRHLFLVLASTEPSASRMMTIYQMPDEFVENAQWEAMQRA
jgi:hypothetical protein